MTIALGLIVSGLLHDAAISVFFGAGLFPLYVTGFPGSAAYRAMDWLPRLLFFTSLLALASGIAWAIFTVASLHDSLASAFDPANVWMFLGHTNSGRIWATRLALAAGLTVLLSLEQTSARIYGALIGSAILLVSLAGTGHAGAGDSATVTATVHILADAMHLLAASIWIGALVALLMMLMISKRTRLEADATNARNALARFSEIGGIVVAVLLLTGIMNPNVLASFSTRYGQVLLTKLVLFGAMLLLAAANRFWLSPRLESALDTERRSEGPIRALYASVLIETTIAGVVLATVAWLAILSPGSAE